MCKRRVILILVFSGLIFSFSLILSQSQCDKIIHIQISHPINPVISEFIINSIQKAEKENACALIISLDTPGGLLDSTRDIVKSILNSEIPVVVYVSPSGARAASAGVFITLAANIAAMAPGTNIGAAHPVDLEGEEDWGRKIKEKLHKPQPTETPSEETEKESEKQTNKKPTPTSTPESEYEIEPSVMGKKIMEDTIAWIKAIATKRGRNVDWAIDSVEKSISITAEEALEKKVIDVVVPNIEELLKWMQGKEVETAKGKVVINTEGKILEKIEMTFRQRLLSVLTNPNIAYILMSLGTLGLFIEIYSPGTILPGVVGGICIILAFYAFQFLPVNYAGVALIMLAIILFILEFKVVSYGALTIGGVISMLLGSLMLFDTSLPYYRVSKMLVLATIGTVIAIVLLVLGAIIRTHRKPAKTGFSGLLHELGTAETDIAPNGKISIHGELWSATSSVPIKKGEKVRVLKAESLILEVEPVEKK